VFALYSHEAWDSLFRRRNELKALRSVISLGLLALLCFLLFSCSDNDETVDDPGLEDFIRQGKQHLINNEAHYAAVQFEKALAIDADNTDAQAGLVMAGPMRLFNFIDQVISTINAISFNPENNVTNAQFAPSSINGDDINAIHLFFIEEVLPELARAEEIYPQLMAGPDFTFELEHYGFRMNGEDLLSYGGLFDKTDLHMIGAFNSISYAIVNLLLAHDLRFDYTQLAIELGSGGAEKSTLETIDMIMSLLYELFHSERFPHFLYLEPGSGVESMNITGLAIANAFTRMVDTFDSLAAETGPQDNSPVHYVDVNGNGVYDRDADRVFLGQEIEIQPTEVDVARQLCVDIADAFYESSTQDPNPYEVALLSMTDFNDLLHLVGVLPIELGPLTIRQFPGLIRLNVGSFFAHPSQDGLRSFLQLIIDIWNDPSLFFE